MSSQQLLLRQDLTISQILRTYGKQFKQIHMQYSDRRNGRCAIGVIMSYYGWDGRIDFDTACIKHREYHLRPSIICTSNSAILFSESY